MRVHLSKKRTVSFLLIIPFIAAGFFAVLIVYHASFHNGAKQLSIQGQNTLELYITYLQGLLGKYESLPQLLTNDDLLVKSLLNPGSRDRINELNRYLETINRISGTSDTYLMDRDGLTIAASNWQDERPFIGRNFSYRPYFKAAMRGELGRYFALGTTSSKRGYYFAYPVRKNNEILGAVVVKVKVEAAEEKWKHLDQELAVLDPDGVVFITTNPKWRYKVIGKLLRSSRERIEKSKRYPVERLSALVMQKDEDFEDAEIISFKEDDRSAPRKYLVQSARMAEAGWYVKIFSDMALVEKAALNSAFYTLLIELLVFITGLMLMHRHKRLKQLKRYELQTRKMLQESNEELESRVMIRTAELTETNKRLTREIQDRVKTEEELQQTRDELLHAAKLAALGQMSAGINHEMNQPLAAIRSYADNARQFLEKERFEDTLWNLEQIAELTERMGQVVAQLKLFSRKSSGKIVRVPLHGALDGAMEILRPIISKLHINFIITLNPENVEIMANNVLLQQVFVNLITNAIHAVEGKDNPQIEIISTSKDNKVFILVRDNGIGIPDNKLKQIFEPFYTTKLSGQGLGLGLTITERILKEVGGAIYIASSPLGTSVELVLNEARE